MTPPTQNRNSLEESKTQRSVAVIDIGATSIRMAIAEICQETQRVRMLETLAQPVNLGKDTFSSRRISKSSIEECVRILRSYKKLLNEYEVVDAEQLRVVATSAVRESLNRMSFLDRVFIATGMEVETLEEAEVNRIKYMGVQPLLQSDPRLGNSKTTIVEIGSGSTEILMVKSGNVLLSNTYRLGSLRLLETLEKLNAPRTQMSSVLANQIERFANQIHEQLDTPEPMEMVALGGDIRFCAANLSNSGGSAHLRQLPIEAVREFVNDIMPLNPDQIANKFGLNFQDAETVGPSLLSYLMLAEKLGCRTINVAQTNLRDGLLQDLALRDSWTAEFRNQIIRSAISLGRKFGFHETHARHVATLSRKLFEDLQNEHQLDRRYELIVYLAAILHEIGLFVNVRSNHKHAMYLIRNSDLFGLNRSDTNLVALVARYHRRSSPQPNHELFSSLRREDRVVVSKLASILRLAIALDESRSQRISTINCRREKSRIVISAIGVDDVSIEKLALRQSGSLFEETFALRVLLRPQMQN